MARNRNGKTNNNQLPRVLWVVAAALMVLVVIRVIQREKPNELATGGDPVEIDTNTTSAGPRSDTGDTAPREAIPSPAEASVITRARAAQNTVDRVSGVGIVDELIPPRSFWVKQDTARMLVAQVVVPANVPVKAVRVGQVVQLDSAKIKRNRDMSNFPGEAGPTAWDLAAEQPIYLLIRTGNLQVRP